MQLEEAIRLLGSFRLYQLLLYSITCHASICTAVHLILALYALNVPKHRCRIPQLGKDDSWNLNSSIVSQFVPSVDCGNSESDSEGGCFDSCRLFSNVSSNETVGCVAGWVYDTSEFDTTFSMEKNFVCSAEGKALQTFAIQSYFFGFIIGSMFTGYLSDRFGRRLTLIACLLSQGAFGLVTGFVSGSVEFWICRFLCGAGSSGVFPTAFVLGIEFIKPSMRLHAAIVIMYANSLGLVVMAVVASFVRDWRLLMVGSAATSLLVVFYFWFLPESPRWLMAVGRHDEAESAIRKAARFNRVRLPENLTLQENTEPQVTKEKFAKVFRYSRLVFLFVNIVFQWFTVAIIFRGLSYNADALPGNIFFTSMMNAVSDLIGNALIHLLLALYGRKKPHVASMFACGILLISTLFPVIFKARDLRWLYLVLALLGKMCAAASYTILYLWTAEQAPTSMRQTIVGVAALAGRIGTVFGPLINDIAKILNTALGDSLQLVLFGGLAVVAGFAALQMPETMGRRLPETLKEGDDLMKAQRLGCSCATPDALEALADYVDEFEEKDKTETAT